MIAGFLKIWDQESQNIVFLIVQIEKDGTHFCFENIFFAGNKL